ncbi:hypothetical protein I4U23_028828 [Adineta vaga]|nr:hypothetical protein I4U23_028828 [Adineta vaga]
MDGGHLTIENVTQLLHQHTFPASVEAALLAIRECSMFTRQDLSMLANQFIFCHSSSTSNTNSTQKIWSKTLNNIQELHTLDLIRQFLENQSDSSAANRVFDMIFLDILSDKDHPLFTLYYNSFLKFLSLVISFESKTALTIIARWFLTLSKATTDTFITKIIEHIIRDHIALAITKSVNNLCIISPLFTLCFINQTCILLDSETFHIDTKVIQTLIELLTFGLTNSTNSLVLTLQQEFLAENDSSLFNFVPSIVRLDILFPMRHSIESTSLRLQFDHFHTSILSFLFSMVTNNSYENQVFQKHLFPLNYFEQIPVTIQDSTEHDKLINECIQRYLQIFAICRTSSLPLVQLSINELGKSFPLLTRDKLFDILKEKEEHIHMDKEKSTNDAESKRTERLARLKELHLRRNEARKLNHAEVIEEDHRKNLPTNYERRCERVKNQEDNLKRRHEAATNGLDYERIEQLEWTAEDCDKWEKKRKKKTPNVGFDNYEQCTYRAYTKLTAQIKPDMEACNKQKEELGEDYYATASSMIHGTHKPSDAAVNRMVEDLDQQYSKRGKFSRRRAFDIDADIDYINERNRAFNKKIERYYGKYTAEIKQNLERGTAV